MLYAVMVILLLAKWYLSLMQFMKITGSTERLFDVYDWVSHFVCRKSMAGKTTPMLSERLPSLGIMGAK